MNVGDVLYYSMHYEMKTSLEEDPFWQLIHNPVDLGKTDAKKVDEYLYNDY